MIAPPERLRAANSRPIRRGRHVLYWMIDARRTRSSFALEHAVARARELGVGLTVLEALACDHPHASDRFHRFVLDGTEDQARRFAAAGVAYHRYLEPSPGHGRGLLAALAEDAAVVVTDEPKPLFLHPRVARAAAVLPARLEVVDGLGVLPIRAFDRDIKTISSFRRAFAARAPTERRPEEDPLRDLPPRPAIPEAVARRWPDGVPDLAALPIDHGVRPTALRGGETAAAEALRAFVRDRLGRYGEDRDHPDVEGTSGISPWLHWGHLSPHEVEDVARSAAEPEVAAPFLDQLLSWRELALHASSRGPGDRWEAVPDWARRTLEAHLGDRRPALYDRAALDAARTKDPVWNAAQRQLVAEGRIHNAMRMVWGKLVLTWKAHPREAFEDLLALNDRYALDGRDPVTLLNIGWIFGRFDRPFYEQPIFGLVRAMSSAGALRKRRMRGWLDRWSP